MRAKAANIPFALANHPTPRRGEGRRCLPAGQITAGVGWTMRSCSGTRWVPEQSLMPLRGNARLVTAHTGRNFTLRVKLLFPNRFAVWGGMEKKEKN